MRNANAARLEAMEHALYSNDAKQTPMASRIRSKASKSRRVLDYTGVRIRPQDDFIQEAIREAQEDAYLVTGPLAVFDTQGTARGAFDPTQLLTPPGM